jgi:hypothetical protein
MFWQDAGEVADVANAPTPETLAEYAYDKVKVPDTEIDLKPAARSTVNLPTWVWLDKGTFKEVKVRAELPNTGLWAETTAKPIALHLEPGTDDADKTPPAASATSAPTTAPRTNCPPASPGRSPGRAPTAPAATSRTAPSRRPRT